MTMNNISILDTSIMVKSSGDLYKEIPKKKIR